ncbi:hypothetical protein TruAng_007650 [Truncatella angustata]|nr:hypothetical protein TruAng_007650 [Truncatella angustata]
MKRPEDYSKNPNTIRARARKARLDPFTREIEQAKASDSKAVTRAWKLRIKTDEYKDASPNVRKAMLEETESEVMERRKSRGYDADSKIDRFRRINGAAVSGSPPIAGAPILMHPYGGTMTPFPGYMQPMAQMQPAPFTGQVGTQFATPGSYYGHVMPSIEDPRAVTKAPHSQQNLRDGTPLSAQSSFDQYPHSPLEQHDEVDAASDAVTKAGLQAEVKKLKFQNKMLDKAMIGLTNDLVLTKNTLRSQDLRMNQLEERMQIYHGTTSGLAGAEADFTRQGNAVRRFIMGVQRMTAVAAEVWPTSGNDSLNKLGANGVTNGIYQDGVRKDMEESKPVLGLFYKPNSATVVKSTAHQNGSTGAAKDGGEVEDADMTDAEGGGDTNGIMGNVEKAVGDCATND